MLFFRFDSWHTSPLDNRKYAIDIISALNSRISRGSLIEIGCGLGDIPMKANYKRKYFYDISSEVLNAAKFMQKFSKTSSINYYKTFDLLTDSLDKSLSFDAVVLVNWIHGVESEVLKRCLSAIINNNLNKKGMIIFDVIEDNPIYKFNHVIDDLIDSQKFNLRILDGYDFGRKLIFAELK
tara:strand:+ start:1134 stop:1676 length:543 start_codon:yes stop_codon:yes gene_type:complete